MAIMQAYQADLLKDACKGGEFSVEMINELRQSADLTLLVYGSHGGHRETLVAETDLYEGKR